MRRALPFLLPISFAVVLACGDDPKGTTPFATDNPGGDASASSSGSSSSGSSGDGSTQMPSKVNVTMETFDGNTLALAVPKTYVASKTYPLVMVFHGDGGDGPGMRNVHRFDDASGDDAIVVYPSGPGFDWNLYTPYAQNDAASFVEELIASLKTRFTIGNVFGVGWSKGGFFVNQMACRNPGIFRAIVSHAGGAPNEPDDPAATSWPNGYTRCDGQTGGVPALITHGTADGAVGFDSGDFSRMYWAYVNGCQSGRTATTPAPCEEHNGCPGDKPVVFCAIQGGGHGIWSQGVEAGWAFVKRF